MFDSDIIGTTLEAIASDLTATAEYTLNNRTDGSETKEQRTMLHVTAARDMLNDIIADVEECE